MSLSTRYQKNTAMFIESGRVVLFISKIIVEKKTNNLDVIYTCTHTKRSRNKLQSKIKIKRKNCTMYQIKIVVQKNILSVLYVCTVYLFMTP